MVIELTMENSLNLYLQSMNLQQLNSYQEIQKHAKYICKKMSHKRHKINY